MIDKLTQTKIYERYSLEKQLRNKARLTELLMINSQHTKEYVKIISSINWIEAILDIGKAAKFALSFTNDPITQDAIKKDYIKLLGTL